MEDNIGKHCFISGHVQGVFYRRTTKEQADKFGITGWVKNLPDGRVEAKIFGSHANIDNLLKWLSQGPPGAEVHSLESEPISWQSHKAFDIIN